MLHASDYNAKKHMIMIVRKGRKQEIARCRDEQEKKRRRKDEVRMRKRIGSCGIIASKRVSL